MIVMLTKIKRLIFGGERAIANFIYIYIHRRASSSSEQIDNTLFKHTGKRYINLQRLLRAPNVFFFLLFYQR